MAASPRNVYFVSLGCPKNRVDSEVMLGSLAQAGHVLVAAPDQAEVIVVNTCGFIDAAKEESIDTILEMAQFKERGSCQKLVVTGCLTQRYPDDVAREIPEIDHILGSADFSGIADIVGGGGPAPARGPRTLPIVQVSETPEYLYDHTSPRVITGARFSVYVKIAEGCDRPCSFCIIPKLRGPQRSRSIESVAIEVERLVAEGAREVNLVAQDLTRYGADLADKPTLAQLLTRLARVDDLRWIRMHYTYPSAWSDELIDVVAGEPKVVKYVDVPLQHIDDQMLKIMRRGHSSRVTGALLERLRARIPGLVMRSTFIVGHPGETDEMFDGLCRFVEAEELDRVGVFTYSREPGTVSAILPRRVPAAVADERRERLMEIQRGISRRKNQALVGRDIEVLVEGVSDESELLLQGRWYGQAPEIDGSVYLADGSARPGELVQARVTDGSDYDLAASLATA
ncbi:MAG TPA: 30S ribosomal protein S12 methylthiotransferase RimO [Kofleriaceae bacterium]|nr:30S ribosomal protein S12 methylthiotransferase RimO [Kofleriaceae bacterium]